MEMVSMDALITKIMNFAQKLVDADRASLFLVDSKTNQLFARLPEKIHTQNAQESIL
jgi:cAMP and cAMP-inhibited cGMP 3',5'-cyclic phosphodiesterase 10